MSSIITHEALYEILIKEKTRQDLQKIEPEFFSQLSSYLEEKEIILKSQKEKSSFPEEIIKTEKQLRTIKQLSTEIIERRKRKILDLALLNSRTDALVKAKNLLDSEEALYESILSTLKQFSIGKKKEEAKVLKNENSESNNSNAVLVRFIHSVPRFVGTDSNIYGPFIKEDVANLPEKTAQILISKKRAERIQHENP
ncbi:DNA replication complex GINS family protein [Candidatus Woesearchaeota archaeon]|nr:DNA replication complex GINS family protein [Candidatus Woesearchaeota archaeon]